MLKEVRGDRFLKRFNIVELKNGNLGYIVDKLRFLLSPVYIKEFKLKRFALLKLD